MNWEDKALEVAQELMGILGPSYTEKVYEEAFLHELRLQDVPYERQRNIEIVYKNHRIGERRPDCILNPHWCGTAGPEFLVEMKALKKIGKQHILQAQVYLSSMNIPAGILLNFNTETGLPEIRQVTLAERATVQKKPREAAKTKNLEEALLIAANEVLDNLGTEFSYYPSDIYVNAVGVELRDMGHLFHKVTYPILYKNHPVAEYTYDYVFGTGEVAKIFSYKKEDEIAEVADNMRFYNKALGVKTGFILALPQEEGQKPVIEKV